MHYRAISYVNLPTTYDEAILAQFVVHHATDSDRTIRVECLRCHHTCQIFKCRFAVGQLSVNCWYTAGRQYTDRLLGELFFTFTGKRNNLSWHWKFISYCMPSLSFFLFFFFFVQFSTMIPNPKKVILMMIPT